MKLELAPFNPQSAAEALHSVPERDDIPYEAGSVFWLGSVDSKNSKRAHEFFALCHEGRFDVSANFADITPECIYALLARRRTGGNYRLFVLQMDRSPGNPQRCLFTQIFADIDVTQKQEPWKDINADTKLSLKSIFKSAIS